MHTRKISIETLSVDWHHNDHQNSTKYDQSIFEKIVSFSSICFYLSLFVFIHYSVICSFFFFLGEKYLLLDFQYIFQIESLLCWYMPAIFYQANVFHSFFPSQRCEKKGFHFVWCSWWPICFIFIHRMKLIGFRLYIFFFIRSILFCSFIGIRWKATMSFYENMIPLYWKYLTMMGHQSSITITIGLAVFILIGCYIF